MAEIARDITTPSGLRKALDRPPSQYLVYTSAGDHANVAQWIQGPKSFDLWITYYGDLPGSLFDCCDYYNVRKGAKYQNLHFVYQEWPQLLQPYRAVFVLDDDIVIDTLSINRLFDIRTQGDYWAVQPAFSPKGKISHAITRVRRTCLRRHTNFAEMGCVLFRRDVLDAFMKVYDPSLAGWGIDWWYLHVMGAELRGRVAIVDEVMCMNPHDRMKGHREIDRLQSRSVRRANWEMVKRIHGISERRQVEYERFHKPPLGWLRGLSTALVEDAPLLTKAAIRRKLRRFLTRFESGLAADSR
jgi:hypothetical protein